MLKNKSRLEALHGVKELDNQAAEAIWGGKFDPTKKMHPGSTYISITPEIEEKMVKGPPGGEGGDWFILDCSGKDKGSDNCVALVEGEMAYNPLDVLWGGVKCLMGMC